MRGLGLALALALRVHYHRHRPAGAAARNGEGRHHRRAQACLATQLPLPRLASAAESAAGASTLLRCESCFGTQPRAGAQRRLPLARAETANRLGSLPLNPTGAGLLRLLLRRVRWPEEWAGDGDHLGDHGDGFARGGGTRLHPLRGGRRRWSRPTWVWRPCNE